jgi:hypothetical protein
MLIGARVLKTGLAVTLAIFICKSLNIEPASFAAITAVVNMQPSVNKALKNAGEQVIVHITAVCLAIFLGYFLGNGPLIIGLAVILMIMIAIRLDWKGAIVLGVVSIIFILDASPDDFLWHAGVRSLAIFIGLGVALVINRALAPPRYKNILKEHLYELFQDSSAYFLKSLRTFAVATELLDYEFIKPVELEEKLQNVMETYELAREELGSKDNPKLIERLIELCRGFIERGQIIENMTQERIKRRASPDSPIPPEHLSPEFQGILDILMVGEGRVAAVRDRVWEGLKKNHPPGPKGNDADYWAEFDQKMSEWQRKVCGEYYLRAMMEVAVVATEMRWAFRRLRSIYNLGPMEVAPIRTEDAS